MSLNSQSLRVVLEEAEGAAPATAEERFEMVSALLTRNFAVMSTGPGRSAPPDPAAPALILARSDGDGGRVSGGRVRRERWDPATAVALAESARSEWATSETGAWKPWFPVIDYDRCTHCMQCLSFCLFGVYGVDPAKRIEVRNNDQCKTNCPACSRVCPEAAIMFPKYKSGPINGEVVSDADLDREKMKIDISALLGGDVYSLLRTRSERARSRFSKERDADRALSERQKCLTKLAALTADVPPEVLMSLPSPEEIARKAAEAAARAAEARKPA